MHGVALIVEFDEKGLSGDEVYELVQEEYSFDPIELGERIRTFTEYDWDIKSEWFNDEDKFLGAIGEIISMSSPNRGYSLEFGRFSTDEARSMA